MCLFNDGIPFDMIQDLECYKKLEIEKQHLKNQWLVKYLDKLSYDDLILRRLEIEGEANLFRELYNSPKEQEEQR